MDYQRAYQHLCERGKNRFIESFTEQHHIIPRCIGGKDTKENLVRLTPEEHYVAHQLLVKMYPKNRSLIYAAWMMRCGRKNNKMYGWIRRKVSEDMKKNNPAKDGAWNSGKKLDKPLRKSAITEKEKKNISKRMKANNPNADGKARMKSIQLTELKTKRKFNFQSLKEAENTISKKYKLLINHTSVWNNMKQSKAYKGFQWKFIDISYN